VALNTALCIHIYPPPKIMGTLARPLLQEGGASIPSAARVYGQIVESRVLGSMSGLEPNQHGICVPPQTAAAGDGADSGLRIASSTLARIMACDAAGTSPPALHPVMELHVAPLFEAGLIRPLSRPRLLLSFDLVRPPMSDFEHTVQVGSNG